MATLPSDAIRRLAAVTRGLSTAVLLSCACAERPPGVQGDPAAGYSDMLQGSEILARYPSSLMEDSASLIRIVGATRLQNGQVVVADAGQYQLVFFDSAGRVVARRGRQGGGPGEFEGISQLFQCPQDTLVIWDHRLGRLSVFDSDGRYLRQVPLPRQPHDLTCTETGEIVMSVVEGTLPLSTADAPLVSVEIHVILPSGEHRVVVRNVPLGRNRPLEPITRIAAGNGRILVGSAESGTVRSYSYHGDALDSLVLPVARKPATQHHFESFIDELVSIMRPGEEREWGRQHFLQMPRPELLPAFGELLADARGRMWARTSWPGDSATTFAVTSFEDGPVGVATFPVGFEIYEIGRDYVLGQVHGGSGAPQVTLFRLAR